MVEMTDGQRADFRHACESNDEHELIELIRAVTTDTDVRELIEEFFDAAEGPAEELPYVDDRYYNFERLEG